MEDLLRKLETDKKHVYLLLFYRSDCPYTPPTRQAMEGFLSWLKTEYGSRVKVYSIMDKAIQTVRDRLGISREEMPTVPSAVVYFKGQRKWFLARRAPLSVQVQHFQELVRSLPSTEENRAAGAEKGGRGEEPVFLTYYFHRSSRHDPIHMTIVGALLLLQQIRHTPIRFQVAKDMHMHGVLSVHGHVNRTFKGHAAADYLSLLLEVNQRLGLVHHHHQKKRQHNRQGGAEQEREAGDANWADYLTGFTVVAAMLA